MMEYHLGNVSKNVAVIGLGYVGLPVAHELSKKFEVIGYDINQQRVEELEKGIDQTEEISSEELKSTNLKFTYSIDDLKNSNFFIVAVPTPVDESKSPDLGALKGATRDVAKVLKKGDYVVYESTVYPGATEEECLPILEEISGLKLGDFHIGYSPERINPGDKEHTLTKITKVVSGSSEEALNTIADVYGSVVEAGIYKASSIMVAEAAKVIENTQRDLNIALMNELALIFDRIGIDTNEVIDAASTKWNFLPFRPGLVGGHCIGVDPYYLTHKAEKIGYQPDVILSGRKINDNVGKFISDTLVKEMVKLGIDVPSSKIAILGATFKENCPDTRNSKVFEIVNELKALKIRVDLFDPLANKEQVLEEYGVELSESYDNGKYDGVIWAVPHKTYKEKGEDFIDSISNKNSVLIDVKGMVAKNHNFKNIKKIWRL